MRKQLKIEKVNKQLKTEKVNKQLKNVNKQLTEKCKQTAEN